MLEGRSPRVVGSRRHRVLAILAVAAVSLAGVGCSDGGGDAADDFTNRPGQNAPAAPGDNSSSTTTTSGDSGMGTSGDDTSGQVGK